MKLNINQTPKRRGDTLAGFTIVELLIVIVVIGILAAISIVAYNGIQNRANDTAVKNDISAMAKKLHLAAAESGEFLEGGSAVGDSTRFPGFTYEPNKSSWMEASAGNLHYCIGDDSSGNQLFRLSGQSKSGKTYMYDSSAGLKDIGNTSSSHAMTCSGLEPGYTFSYGFFGTTKTWWGWTNG